MADGRDIAVWDNHAHECEEAGRNPFGLDECWMYLEMNKLENVHRILDVGCGPCYWITLFRGKQYNAIDQSAEMLRVAKDSIIRNKMEGAVGELRQGNARNLLDVYKPGEFDLVFTSSVLQHNRHDPDKTEIVRGIHAILRDGGYFMCTEDTCRTDNHPECVNFEGCLRGPQYTFKAEGWKRYMLELGFETVGYSKPSEYLYKKI